MIMDLSVITNSYSL